MKDELPAPAFDSESYERPTQPWLCGHAAQGKPCPRGPDARGRCGATFECSPHLNLKEGETKGRYSCTRTDGHGGRCPCEGGPLPDGTCSHPIPKCQPVRTLRSRRGLLTANVVALTFAALALLLGGRGRYAFVNPGGLSIQHSGATFAQAREQLGIKGPAGPENCAACHKPAEAGLERWIAAALGASPGPFEFRQLVSTSVPGMSSIDVSCLRCHNLHRFHQPNVDRSLSCSVCHQEHLGAQPMKAPAGKNCLSCHGSPAVMETSFQIGKRLPSSAFDYRPSLGRIHFQAPRPARGYTQIFHSFAADHPEFQALAEDLKDPSTLKFNHQRHFAEDIPLLRSRKLECVSCHQRDAAGAYHMKLTYEQHCQACHSLQFDLQNPKLLIPHGSSEAVRAFLQSLPAQYADYGAREKQITGRRESEDFVRQSLRSLREQLLAGENLEDKVFFSTKRWAPGVRVGELPGPERPLFYGCAYCHEVKSGTQAAPVVTPPVMPDRWFIRAEFNHTKHDNVACASCHGASGSRETSDILLPSKSVCVECHSPQGGVANDCSRCHAYHTHVGQKSRGAK
ncbi:MAG: cytochrome c3 family protein [Verrucomicrobia bacterium]|nr:cytochrome c3 family protein [Verrucomicrobiota bacterium]